MIPFWDFGTNKKPTRQENMRAFRIVFWFLVSVAVVYAVIALSVFGHL